MSATSAIPEFLWAQRIPLHITHPSYPNTPLITTLPRFSYLGLLFPRLHSFFRAAATSAGISDTQLSLTSFHHEDVLLRNLPVGLLVDLYQPTLPWRLTVGSASGWDLADSFLNGVKEADYIRNGTAKRIMSLSKEDTATLWNAVQDNDYPSFAKANAYLLNAPTALRSVPMRIYIPSAPPPGHPSSSGSYDTGGSNSPAAANTGAFKVLQSLVPPRDAGNRNAPTLLGQALRSLLPSLFPSSRDPVLADAVLHGSPVPFNAPLEELMREAAYPDGWVCLVVVLL